MCLGFEPMLPFFRAPAYNNSIFLPPNRGHLANTFFLSFLQANNTISILEAHSSSKSFLCYCVSSTFLCTLTRFIHRSKYVVSHLKTK